QHEQRLLQYRQTLSQLPVQGMAFQPSGRPDPYANNGEEDIYFGLIARFAIDFEKMYINWLRDALTFLEEQKEH
ncbi:MAG TPA: hypothetical protein VFN35_29510, partial [Ktedonobacteraceae bacterium]|nr:hypothetical protein [Ktedonobacteraceae bacterium]